MKDFLNEQQVLEELSDGKCRRINFVYIRFKSHSANINTIIEKSKQLLKKYSYLIINSNINDEYYLIIETKVLLSSEIQYTRFIRRCHSFFNRLCDNICISSLNKRLTVPIPPLPNSAILYENLGLSIGKVILAENIKDKIKDKVDYEIEKLKYNIEDNLYDIDDLVFDIENDRYYHRKLDIYINRGAILKVLSKDSYKHISSVPSAVFVNKLNKKQGYYKDLSSHLFYNMNKILPLHRNMVSSDEQYANFENWFLRDNDVSDLELFIICIKEKYLQIFTEIHRYNEVILDFVGMQGTGKSALAQAIGTCFGSYINCKLDKDNQFTSQYYDAPVCILDECQLFPKDYDFLKKLTQKNILYNQKNKNMVMKENQSLFIITHNGYEFYETIDKDDRRLKTFIFDTKIDLDLIFFLPYVINYIIHKLPVVLNGVNYLTNETSCLLPYQIRDILESPKSDAKQRLLVPNYKEFDDFFNFLKQNSNKICQISTEKIKEIGFSDFREFRRNFPKYDCKLVKYKKIPSPGKSYYVLWINKNHNNQSRVNVDDTYTSAALNLSL